MINQKPVKVDQMMMLCLIQVLVGVIDKVPRSLRPGVGLMLLIMPRAHLRHRNSLELAAEISSLRT
jgi:hypothetical protein